MKTPRVKVLRPACGMCHANTDGEACGCADRFRKPWWLWCTFVPKYRPHRSAHFTKPHHHQQRRPA